MPNISSFGAQTDNAVVSGTVTDRQMIIPEVPPQGLMSVGPRVTPNFIKEPWSKLRSYNFFDVVKDVAGSSYIAIKPVVPTNTELTDEEFWFKWSDPDAQLNELQEIVKLYDGRISQNTSAIAEEIARAKAAEQAEEQRATAAEATKAPVNHASEETVYGVGNAANYGHLKLTDNDTPATSGANDGVAVTPQFMFKHMPYKTVEDYGVDASVNDNSNNLQNAINDCAKNNYILVIPPKTYKINGSLTLPNNAIITGFGVDSILHFNTKDNAGFKSAVDENGHEISGDIYLYNFAMECVLENDENYNETNCCGLKGMFYGRVESLKINNFSVGVITSNEISQPDYNIYNYKYGKGLYINNIALQYCSTGCYMHQADMVINNILFNVCRYIGEIDGTITNMHAWGFTAGVSFGATMASNIEIESSNAMSGEWLEPFITITAESCNISNLNLWNGLFIDYNIKGSKPYIKVSENVKNVNITNLRIGPDQVDPSILKRAIIECGNATVSITGTVNQQFTSKASYVEHVLAVSKGSLTHYITGNSAIGLIEPTQGAHTFQTSN